MRAYGILDGGGVKGAALVGALQAAKNRGIEFVGYGGTSAGSIIALLASVGYTPEELQEIMINEINFTDFLDNAGGELEKSKTNFEELFQLIDKGIDWGEIVKIPDRLRLLNELFKTFKELNQTLGLCDANGLKNFLITKIVAKIPNLSNNKDISFRDLLENECCPLKVVASDLISRRSVVYPSEQDGGVDYSVIDAVRASMSFPFVFKPVNIHDRFLVDGGLSTNLPIFLFEKERKNNNYPVVAFDLVIDEESSENIDDQSQSNTTISDNNYGLINLSRDMLATALEASDELLGRLVQGKIYYIPIPIPKYIGTLDFVLSRERRKILFDRGNSRVSSYFNNKVFQAWEDSVTRRERFRVLYGKANLVEKLLKKIAEEIESLTNAKDIRAYIMLPTDRNTLLATYQYGMDDDPDIDWEIPLESGFIYYAWTNRKYAIGSIDIVRQNPQDYNLTKIQSNKIRKDRKAIYCVPMYDKRNEPLNAQSEQDWERLGVLCVDTSTSPENTLWLDEGSPIHSLLSLVWAETLSYILT